MNSALYQGWVSHRRLLPRTHSFRYPIGLLYLDLDEREHVLALSPLAGSSRMAAFSLRETDFLPAFTRHGIRLKDAVLTRVAQALGARPDGKVFLLAQPRSWGVAFNPASFFYCYAATGQLQAILCEVSNTPWRERYHYVLPTHAEGESRHRVDKSFHVSPFLPRDLEYRMRFTAPEQRLRIDMQDWQGDALMFEAHLALKRVPLTRASLHRHLLRFPWMTGKTLWAIYWQALRLALKRIPFYPHQPADGEYRRADLESRHD